MHKARKTQVRDAVESRAGGGVSERCRLPSDPKESPDTVLEALAERIGRDASDNAAWYLLRSDTAHDGE